MRYIDHQEIYRLTNQGLDILEYFFPGEDLRNPRRSFKIRNEKTPSARVSWYNGYWRITDFGNQDEVNGMKAIEFVMWRQGLAYYDALVFIENVIIKKEISSGDFKQKKYQADYSFREMTKDDKKGEYNFTRKEKPSKTDLEAIGRYVDKNILEEFHCVSLEQYEFCSFSKKHNKDVVHVFKSTEDYPIFLFDYGDFKKLYKPHEQDKKYRFLYIGEKPKNYIYGLNRIMKADNEFVDEEEGDSAPPEGKPEALVKNIFRCSGESDAMNLASLGYHVYWLNSESADYGSGQFRKINDLCEYHYQIMDLDATGQKMAIKKGLQYIDLRTVELPKSLKFKKDFRGNPCKDLKDFLNLIGKSADETSRKFRVLYMKAKPMKFWEKKVDKDKGTVTYSLNLEFLYWFLQANGFYSMSTNYIKKADYCYAHITGKVVELIHPNNMKKIVKRFVKEWVKSKDLMDEIAILNKINSSNQISESNLQELHEIDLNFENYDINTEHLNFNNGSLRITKSKIEYVKHDKLPNFILGKLEVGSNIITHIIDKNINLNKSPIEIEATAEYQELLNKYSQAKTAQERDHINARLTTFPVLDRYKITINDSNFIFTSFLMDLARLHWRKELEKKEELSDKEKKEQDLCLANLLFVLGYHCSQYKHSAKPWLTFLQDMKVSEVGKSSGRSGKSLLSQAVKQCRASFYIGGRELRDSSKFQFLYDGLTEFHDFIEVDDFHEFGDFSYFYTQITGDRPVNPKNQTPYTLPYEKSGKMLMSTNFELQNTDNSTMARILNCGVSDYYHESSKYNDYKESRSPYTKFGKGLFKDFTDEEWNKFYNLMAYCIQMQMRFPKIQPPMENLEKRQLRREMAKGLGREEEFMLWAESYFMINPNHVNDDQVSCKEFGWFNSYISKDAAFENFLASLSPAQRSKYKSGTFKKHIIAYCEYYGFKFNPPELCANRDEVDPKKRRIMKWVDGRTQEVFYLRTNVLKEEVSFEQEKVQEEMGI